MMAAATNLFGFLTRWGRTHFEGLISFVFLGAYGLVVYFNPWGLREPLLFIGGLLLAVSVVVGGAGLLFQLLSTSQRVADDLAPSAIPRGQLTQLCGFADEEIGGFRDTFLHSGKDSVDAFLEH